MKQNPTFDVIEQQKLLKMDELELIQYRRNLVKQKMESSRKKMRNTYDRLTRKEEMPSDKWGKAAYFMSRGGTIIQGLRTGYKIATAVSLLMKLKRRFSSKP